MLPFSTPKQLQPSILSHHPIQVLVLFGCLLSIHQLGGFLLDDVQSLIMGFNQLLQAVQLFLMGLQNRSEKIQLDTTLGNKRKESLEHLAILQTSRKHEHMVCNYDARTECKPFGLVGCQNGRKVLNQKQIS